MTPHTVQLTSPLSLFGSLWRNRSLVAALVKRIVKIRKCPRIVILVKTGIQKFQRVTKTLDTGFPRRDDF